MAKAVQATVLGSIRIVCTLTHCTVCDLKIEQMNMQLRLYKSELSYNTAEAIKNICGAKGDSAVDHSKVTR